MRVGRGILAAAVLVIATFSDVSQAQKNNSSVHTFRWNFVNDTQQGITTMRSCDVLQISVSALDGHDATDCGAAPYYMMALDKFNQTTTYLLGSDPQNLSWQVKSPVGSQVILSVADSHGNAGGMANTVFNVVQGDRTDCVKSQFSPTLAITPDRTRDINTCDELGLTVTGGVPPYNVVLAQVGAPNVVNITLSQGINRIDWINQAFPNAQILFSVSDSTGLWGQGSGLINTVGSTNTTCPGLFTRLSTMTAPAQPVKLSLAVIVGVAAGGTLIVIAVLTACCCWKRKKKQDKLTAVESGVGEFFKLPDTDLPQPPPPPVVDRKQVRVIAPEPRTRLPTPLDPARTRAPHAPTITHPVSANIRTGKAAEAYAPRRAVTATFPRTRTTPTSTPGRSRTMHETGSVGSVVYHEDAGRVEVPPPYIHPWTGDQAEIIASMSFTA